MTSVNDGVMIDVVAAWNKNESKSEDAGFTFFAPLLTVFDIGKDLQITTLYISTLAQSLVTSTHNNIEAELLFDLVVNFSLSLTLPVAPTPSLFFHIDSVRTTQTDNTDHKLPS